MRKFNIIRVQSTRIILFILFLLLILYVTLAVNWQISAVFAYSVTAKIPVGQGPRMLAYDPIHHYIFVPNTGDNTVSVIKDGDTMAFTTIRDPGFNVPFGAAFNPSNGLVYVTNLGSHTSCGNTVSVIETADVVPRVIDSIKVGNCPLGVAFNEDNHKMYVVNYASASVSVIDSSTNIETGNVFLGFLPYYIAYNPLDKRMYVPNHNSGIPPCPTPSTCQQPATVDVIRDDVLVGRIPVDRLPNNLAFNPINRTMYVITNQDGIYPVPGRILLLDVDPSSPTYQTVTNTIESNQFGDAMQGIAYNPVNRLMYVTTDANTNAGTVAEIDIHGNIRQFIPVGEGPWGIGLADQGRMYVATQLSNNVSRLGSIS
jgi:YVTN family beta-propeller protein